MWTRCDETLPELDAMVWLADAKGVWLGARADDVDGWLWVRTYDAPTWTTATGWYVSDLESDDDLPTHWAPLPEPPAQD